MLFLFRVVAHVKQRYDTCGDWYKRGRIWVFTVSQLKDRRHIYLVFLHELIEWAIAHVQGIRPSAVDRFDLAYERGRKNNEARTPCGCRYRDEPGDDPHAPYHHAHQVATECERLIAKALDVDWLEYGKAIDEL